MGEIKRLSTKELEQTLDVWKKYLSGDSKYEEAGEYCWQNGDITNLAEEVLEHRKRSEGETDRNNRTFRIDDARRLVGKVSAASSRIELSDYKLKRTIINVDGDELIVLAWALSEYIGRHREQDEAADEDAIPFC